MRVGIVGAGPIGIYAAKFLLSNQLDVVLIEAGSRNSESLLTIHDYKFATSSKMATDIHKVGGGTNKWKGRVSLFPRTSIEATNSSGFKIWPIEWREIETAYSRFATSIGLHPIEYEDSHRRIHICDFCDRELELSTFQFIEPNTFVQMFNQIVNHPRLTFMPETFCKRIVAGTEDSKRRLIFKSRRQGKIEEGSVEVDYVLVAAGCLQSSALIYRSYPEKREEFPIGKYLQEHFDGYIGRLHVRRKDKNCLENFRLNSDRKILNKEMGVGIRPSRDTFLRWHLELAPLARVYLFDPTANRYSLSPRFLNILFQLERLVSGPLFRISKWLNTLLGRETFSLWLKGEELPFRESRVFVDDRNEEMVFYNHRVSRETRSLMRKEIKAFGNSLKSKRLGKIVLSPSSWFGLGINTGANWHPLGALRMHASEEKVLNADATLVFDNRVM